MDNKSICIERQGKRKEWVIAINSRLENTNLIEDRWSKHSIYKIPTSIRRCHEGVYDPQMVSLGPYHHGNDCLKLMEEHKQRALCHLLCRTNKPIDAYAEEMEKVVQPVMDSYEVLEEEWKDQGRFLKMMILDGCFMLEILRTVAKIPEDYVDNDPIFSVHGRLYNMPYIKRDMLMLENQLPLLVLERLLAVETGRAEAWKINNLVLKFYDLSDASQVVTTARLGMHVLDVVRKSMLHESPEPPKKGFFGLFGGVFQTKSPPSGSRPKTNESEVIRPATELHEAGIEFKKMRSESLKAIKFEKGILNGTLMLPTTTVDDNTKYTFLNLMAFERLHVGAGNEVTSFVSFMDNIIDTEKDVRLLHKEGIIKSLIGTDKSVANLFNTLSMDVSIDPTGGLEKVHKDVNDYCKIKWNEWRANLFHQYFRNPWAMLSVFAAIILLGLTVAQFVYSVMDFYRN